MSNIQKRIDKIKDTLTTEYILNFDQVVDRLIKLNIESTSQKKPANYIIQEKRVYFKPSKEDGNVYEDYKYFKLYVDWIESGKLSGYRLEFIDNYYIITLGYIHGIKEKSELVAILRHLSKDSTYRFIKVSNLEN